MTPRPPGPERLGLLLLLGGFFAFNVATCNYYPTVWCDEVWFAEPAVNLVRYGSFTTRIWQLQPFHTFPAVNCPLYPMALAPWLAATGTSVLAVRSLNYALMASGGFLFWLALWRFGWVRSSGLRLLAVAALHLGYGMSFSYRCSRPDMLGVNCLLLLLLALQIRPTGLRGCCLVVLAAATVWIGLQVALFAGFAAALWWLLRRSGFKELLLLAGGMTLGAASLLLFLASKGVLPFFLGHALGFVGKHYNQSHHSAGSTVLKVVLYSLRNYLEDFSLTALLLGLAMLLGVSWKQLSLPARRLVLYCLVLLFAVPPLFNLVGHFAFYYSCMRFVPGVLVFFAVWSDLASSDKGLSPILRLAFAATLTAVVAVGLPLRFALTSIMYHVAPRTEIRRMVQGKVGPTDTVFTEEAAFFEAKEITPAVYDLFSSPTFLYFPMSGSREFTPEQKREVSVLIIRPAETQSVTNFFGGSWAVASPLFGDTPNYERLARLPLIGGKLVHYAEQPQNRRSPLLILRRQTNPAP